MSEIKVTCEGCSTELALPASSAGKKGRCPNCEFVFSIPEHSFEPLVGVPVADASSPFAKSNPYSSPVHTNATTAPSKFDDANPPPLSLMTVPLYISAVLYLMFGIGAIVFIIVMFGSGEFQGPAIIPIAIMMFGVLMCFGLSGFIIFFTGKLKQRKKWAWITAIAFGGLYAPSAFIFLGVPILIGALQTDVQNWFTKQ